MATMRLIRSRSMRFCSSEAGLSSSRCRAQTMSSAPCSSSERAGSPSRPARPISWYQLSGDEGIAAWATQRTSGRSMPMPKATVAAITTASPPAKRLCAARLSAGSMPAWKAIASWPFSRSQPAVCSQPLRVEQ